MEPRLRSTQWKNKKTHSKEIMLTWKFKGNISYMKVTIAEEVNTITKEHNNKIIPFT